MPDFASIAGGFLGGGSGGGGGGYGGTQTTASSATGGTFDAQSKFSFGGINTAASGQSYVAMGLIALTALGLVWIIFAHRR